MGSGGATAVGATGGATATCIKNITSLIHDCKNDPLREIVLKPPKLHKTPIQRQPLSLRGHAIISLLSASLIKPSTLSLSHTLC
ncbi:hypothetical protein RIF29_38433 [Crotalaria pallida]|uniref:Uncharacterized protein n=1 Tax=Crotalaria pallida TaxID=3830 RepID=A0AAN9E1Q8_CROPI